jgi:hypothetical protein
MPTHRPQTGAARDRERPVPVDRIGSRYLRVTARQGVRRTPNLEEPRLEIEPEVGETSERRGQAVSAVPRRCR